MSKPSRIGAINHQFLTKIKPELNSWGLAEHPNPLASFGRYQYGYRYDFADLSDRTNIRLVTFVINTDATLWIKGYKAGPMQDDAKSTILLFDTVKGIFTLGYRWSLRHFFDGTFRLNPKNNELLDAAASRLIQDVATELPRLRQYLYA